MENRDLTMHRLLSGVVRRALDTIPVSLITYELTLVDRDKVAVEDTINDLGLPVTKFEFIQTYQLVVKRAAWECKKQSDGRE